MCTFEEIARGTHAHRASKLGPVDRWWAQDGKLGISIQVFPSTQEKWRVSGAGDWSRGAKEKRSSETNGLAHTTKKNRRKEIFKK